MAGFLFTIKRPENIAAPCLKKFKPSFVIGFALLLALSMGIFFWWRWATSPIDANDDTRQVFVVPQGQTANTIGKRLEDQGYIRSQLAFKLLLNRKSLDAKLQAGDFYISYSMDLPAIIESLAHGSLDYWLTIPEGWRSEQVAAAIAKKSSLSSPDFIVAAKPYEGRLFPDTYLIPQQATAEDIVSILTNNFDKKFSSLKLPQPQKFSPDQLIIIASLIEREARHESDRPLVSSVIYNRLNLGMALQLDATVQYALGQPDNWWSQNLSREQLTTLSAYNTYAHPGLPPAPIANPGLAALEAAIDPADTDYLYYVSDSGGYNHYAKDIEGHNQNISQYLN